MNAFLDTILAFPTAIFTIVLGVVMTYWLFVIVGAVGIDVFDADVSLDGDISVEGAGKALGSAKALAGSDADFDVDGGGILAAMGFAGIPITVSVSFVVFIAWFLSVMSAQPLNEALGGVLPSWLLNSGLGLACFAAGTVTAGFAVRPLRPVFVAKRAPGRDSLMGRVCTISSGSVTARTGHATFEDGGAGVILNVVCAKPNELKRGQPALILAYDAERRVYEVEPVDWLLPEEQAQLQDPARAAALARVKARG
ncbi:Rossmann fold nucleotide-binding protein Smf [Myxococcus hansupus]|uniref:Rossmann fold nucleotide-binding protein Smf n=1 Tax=Pseudomyxococcus hansupus TaxID=1297742 RepID=A0A0H4WYJ8_9BACT|nr:hypothetical protein [Myxococcus hansupus]AKQ66430.1 Rossmann fold nucleotide-binding protein Smf [Myxococcus hansupus]